ncbi:Chromatin structure-remodeling complex protein rsc9 [Steccherinum ochraceum]|uniref:Chromatin structure-remodeling complex protein rsc9 n=1 Tax=Steccherinum ochraceum TaxID=92696 RepID=A0A4R0R4Y6_9APHY|nr:Chromatin structure-remodeling complex protein rsc9 [Steccherinum ochraceum]
MAAAVYQPPLNVPRPTATPVQGYGAAGYPAQAQPQQEPRSIPPEVYYADDHERWYSELHVVNNRMVLALKSGIDSEIEWSLERLSRLSPDDKFQLHAMPGLTDALFEWPDWYVGSGAAECAQIGSLFSLPKELVRRRRFALSSVFILRNASMQEMNAGVLAAHSRARSLILFSLHSLPVEVDSNAEFVLYVIEILQSISGTLILPPANSPLLANPVPPLHHMAERSSNRSLILASLSTLTLLLNNPGNAAYISPANPGLIAAVRYLALFASDRELTEACLDHLYSHLAHPVMAKAFLLHPELSAVLKLLTLILKSEQLEHEVIVPLGGLVHTAPVTGEVVRNRELSTEESERLLVMAEPDRCTEWLKIMFVANPEAETTQVDLWTLYRTAFSVPGRPAPAILQAHDVIKNASVVFPKAAAMVLQGPQQRFVVRGIERATETPEVDRFRCRWAECENTQRFASTSELYDHLLQAHIDPVTAVHIPCQWSSCSTTGLTKNNARRHVLTHLPPMQPPPRNPAQPESITLPAAGYPHPIPDPTSRPPPPPRNAELRYKAPVSDPPSNALTALLCIRVLFRASFASSDTAPRVDEDHFGFPGVVEENAEDEEEERHAETEAEREGERRGRKAFIGIRHLLEEVRIRDEILMSWITEMVEAGITGTT